MTSPAGGRNQTGSQDLHPCSHRILRNGARLGRPCKVPRTRARNLGCISTAALARFFFASAGPSHSTISRVLTGTWYGDDYVYDASGQGPNKEFRVLQALNAAQRRPARARELVEELLSSLRTAGLLGVDASGRT